MWRWEESVDWWRRMADHTVRPPNILGHRLLEDSLLDERDHGHSHIRSENEVVFEDRTKTEDLRKNRVYKKGNWTAAEILVLQVYIIS